MKYNLTDSSILSLDENVEVTIRIVVDVSRNNNCCDITLVHCCYIAVTRAPKQKAESKAKTGNT